MKVRKKRKKRKERMGKSYELSRSLNQELTFETLNKEMESRNLEFGQEQKKNLHLIGEDGLYTNLALLLSDQCQHTIKIAVFQGTDNAVFRDRREFTGSLLKQLEEAYGFLDYYNKTEAYFEGIRRTDRRDYPEAALREALLNSILHRDYLFSGSTIINVFDDHVEFISLGGLVTGISMEAIFMGASESRNNNLAALFYRLGLVESYGTGVRKIIRLYKGFDNLPVFRSAEGAFTVEMWNMNEKNGSENTNQAQTLSEQTRETKGELKEKIYEFIKIKNEVTRKDIEDEFKIGSTKAFKHLKQLCADGAIMQNKNGNKTTYRV